MYLSLCFVCVLLLLMLLYMRKNRLIELMKHLNSRLKAPTPPWFKFVRSIGLYCSSVGLALTALPVELPVFVDSFSIFMLIAGATASAVAQTAANNE